MLSYQTKHFVLIFLNLISVQAQFISYDCTYEENQNLTLSPLSKYNPIDGCHCVQYKNEDGNVSSDDQIDIQCGFNGLMLENLTEAIVNVVKSKNKVSRIYMYNFVLDKIPNGYFNILNGSLLKLEIDCLRQNLTIQENSFQGLEASLINLKITAASDIAPKCFNNLVNLKTLEIMASKFEPMSKLDVINFSGLKKLESFSANYNIGYMESETFSKSLNLKILQLIGNHLKTTAMAAFKNLTTLEELNLSDNEIDKIENNQFENMNKMKSLMLDGNSIVNLTEKCFIGLANLKTLSLRKNRLSNIHSKAFEPLHSLNELGLNNNNLELLHDDIFSYLKNLKKLDLQNNHLLAISQKLFSNLKQLDWLLLADNNISSIEYGTFKNLESLTTLSISYNLINEIKSGTFDGLKNLGSLFLSSNRIEKIDDKAFTSLKNLTNLDLENNKIEKIHSALKPLISLTSLDLGKNNITQIKKDNFANLYHLKTLLLKNNSLKYIEDEAFDPLVNLENLNLRQNSIGIITSKTFNLPKLKTLHLNKNDVFQLGRNIFSKLSKLWLLTLDDNKKLSFIDQNAFNGLVSLYTLSLSNTNISNLPESLFSSLTSLAKLDLSNTHCRSFTSSQFNNNKGLDILTIENIELDAFSDEIFRILPTLRVFTHGTTFNCNANWTANLINHLHVDRCYTPPPNITFI